MFRAWRRRRPCAYGASAVQGKRVLLDRETSRARDLILEMFNLVVHEFLDFPATCADKMVVMAAFVKFKYGRGRFEMASQQYACLDKLH